MEAEEKLKETPILPKTPSGYVQQSPWLSIANKQLKLISRYMSELGLTPVARSRVAMAEAQAAGNHGPTEIRRIVIYGHRGETSEAVLSDPQHANKPRSRSAAPCIDVDPER